MSQIGIVGAGAWGTALALSISRAGRSVMLWVHNPITAATVLEKRESPYLPGFQLPLESGMLHITTDPNVVISQCTAILLAIPAQHLRAVCNCFLPYWQPALPAVICAKGIEHTTNALMHEVVNETLPTAVIAVLSGPGFANEVARGLPTALTLACVDPELGKRLVSMLATPTIRPYISDDILGTEIGGAVKNVLAIGCGIVRGRSLGDSACAALITRGLAEIVRLATASGARAETLMGLCGLGDLILTANSMQSRNFSLGLAIGQGSSLSEAMVHRRSVTEGVYSATAVLGRARALAIEMPICEAINDILHNGAPVDEVIRYLLNRPFKTEPWREV